MKKTITSLLLLATMAGFAQNNSSQGPISTTISPASALGAQEVFRFKPGIFTQLQAGSFAFGATDRWSSLGEITTPPSNQRLHGLRLQDNARALLIGYSSQDANGFIQYVGNRGLDVRFASSFTSTESNLAARFNPAGNTTFGFRDPLIFTPVDPTGPIIIDPIPIDPSTRVSTQVDIQSRFRTGLLVRKGNDAILPANFTAADFGGPIVATSATFTSDAQFKQDIKSEDSALEMIKQLNPVSYTFKSENKFGFAFPSAVQHGFIAQELEKVLPELVANHNLEGTGTYKSVNYNGVIAILTKGIQELSAEVENLKSQLAEAKTYVVAKDNFTRNELDKIKDNGYYLGQNTPNPFNNKTEIAYSFPKGDSNVIMMVFNLSGEKLKEFPLKEEKGTVTLQANDFKPGLYLYSLISNNNEIITKKMLVN